MHENLNFITIIYAESRMYTLISVKFYQTWYIGVITPLMLINTDSKTLENKCINN